ncbi:sulfotransferase family protein [Sphingorhabdus arenilitoris]|uniref:Sulfotransferase family protein n=1 Tax=Sphingorhabdus arenilitoris TaxID=1490041 RepID=A0ABV8RL47_9SPHN
MADKLKHRWSIGHNYMTGITFGAWMRVLAENNFHISAPYWHRAAFISLTSMMNSVSAAMEKARYGKAIDAVQIKQPPLFILGHWRSGTTLLHDLLAQDDAQFNYANTYQVVNPLTFLTTENLITRLFPFLVPPTRPMDNMALKFSSPQEDEFAPLLMTLKSLYLGTSFPRREAEYEKYLTFRDAKREEVEAWKAALYYFCQKLALNDDRALLLKSPPHTARIRTILEVFPDARFVHIHRDPYRVFQSQRHFFDTAGWYTYLQRPNLPGIDEGILQRQVNMYDAYFEDLPLIPKGHFCELRFDELEADPVAQMKSVYEQLALPGYGEYQPKLRRYLDGIKGYQKNDFLRLTEDEKAMVYDRWRRSFDHWGYPQ